MIKKLFHEQSIIWRTKKGTIDILIATVFFVLTLLIPALKAFSSYMSSTYIVEEAKETLEIASLATYSRINRNLLGTGKIDVDKTGALSIFTSTINGLANNNPVLKTMQNPRIAVLVLADKVWIVSQMTIFTDINHPVEVKKSMEFIVDPAMEVLE